ncbi:MAG: hypothetical protein MUO54_15670 [Anaerolineales bacterium]|nr:hypothetical protein [Anaerolineales bacterium]
MDNKYISGLISKEYYTTINHILIRLIQGWIKDLHLKIKNPGDYLRGGIPDLEK